MKYADRRKILSNIMQENSSRDWDILDTSFVERYIQETGVSFDPMPYGAPKCRTLGEDLSRMERERRVKRTVTPLPGLGMGFPKWVYSYKLTPWEILGDEDGTD